MKFQRHVALFVGILAATANAAGHDKDFKRNEPNRAVSIIPPFEELGAVVRLDETKPGKPVVDVSLFGSMGTATRPLTDAGLVHLKRFTKLQTLLMLECPTITDDGLVHLKGLTKLKSLYILICPKITDDGLSHLKGLTNLRFLVLINTKVSDAGVKKLKAVLPKCKILCKIK